MEEKIFKINQGRIKKLILLEIVLTVFLVFYVIFPLMNFVVADVVGRNNVTVTTVLRIGEVYPEVLNVSINYGVPITLEPNSTVTINIISTLRDFNGKEDLANLSVRFFNQNNVSYDDPDDNNNHYSNHTFQENPGCYINTSYFSDPFLALGNCTLRIWYYADNSSAWNATIVVTDKTNRNGTGSNLTTVNMLLGIGLPSIIDFGLVNATQVSDEQIANVTNFGNVIMNLSLSGYAIYPGDNLSMNCTHGSMQNISIEYEKYNLTGSNQSYLSYTQFDSLYLNLTSQNIVKSFNLKQRFNDTYNEALKESYWRIYVPAGVAGNCTGKIVFGAVQAPGT